jgi:hypothetical protein
MDTRLKKVLSAFEEKGWTLSGSADVSRDWWFSDIIKLVSKWYPVGTCLYLTLLTDPQSMPKKEVWCIGVSPTIPDSRHFTFLDQITLNDIKRTELNIWVDKINKIILK